MGKQSENSGKMYRDLTLNVDYQLKIIPHSNERDGGGVETAYSSICVFDACLMCVYVFRGRTVCVRCGAWRGPPQVGGCDGWYLEALKPLREVMCEQSPDSPG